MTANLRDEISRQFGAAGVRRCTREELDGLPLPKAAGDFLVTIGLPLRVGPYFTATTGEPIGLAAFAAAHDHPQVSPEAQHWCRVGQDNGAEIVVDPTGPVRAVFLAADAPEMLVNSDVAAFGAFLLALDRYLPLLADPGTQSPAQLFRALRDHLVQVDAPALEDDEAWWPQVLEEIRHALSFPFSAAFEYGDSRGRKQVVTETARVDAAHPERLIWDRLSAQGIRPEQVTRVYTELEPCFLPGNYCAMWLSMFQNAEFTHSFDYGDTAGEREEGILALMRHAAESQG